MTKKNLFLLGCCVAALDLWLLLSKPAPVPRAELAFSAAENELISAPAAGPDQRRLARLAPHSVAGGPAITPTQPRVSSRQMLPHFAARPAEEWQGMLVNLNAAPFCTTSAVCSMARACVDSHCTACTEDADCSGGEACVLDHCVPSAQVTCRDRHDCESDNVCMLSGYSSDVRGNRDMRTLCSNAQSGSAKHAAVRIPVPAQAPGTAPRPAPYAELFESARRMLPPP